MKRVLVTGALGAFGPSVAESFGTDPDCRVFRTDVVSRPGFECIACDLRSRSSLEQLLSITSPDLVIHLAGTLSLDVDDAMAVNVDAARMLLETVERMGMKTRIVLTGSAAEYGKVRPDENPLVETRHLAPVTIYGMTKACQTLLAGVFAQRGVDVLVARIFNLDGPGLTNKLVVGRFQEMMRAYKSGEIDRIKLGPLSAQRDYVSFEDAAKQIRAIAACGTPGEVYHVASGVPVTVREVLRRYLQDNGLDFSCVEEGQQYSNHTGIDVPVVFADTSKTRKLCSMMT